MSARSRANAILRESLAPLILEYKPGDLVLTSEITAKVPAINYHIRPSPQRVGALMKERRDLESVQPGVWRKIAEAEA